MTKLTIGIIILCVVVAAFLIFGIVVLYQWMKANKYPDDQGKKFEFEKDGYKATVIIDNDIEAEDWDIFFSHPNINSPGLKVFIDGNELVKQCWLSIKSINDAYTKLEPNLKKKLNHCYFYYLTNEKFEKLGSKYFGPNVRFVNAYTEALNRHLFKKEQSCAFIRERYMLNTIETGGITIHEFLHAFSYHATDNWDHQHTLNLREAAKNPELIAQEIFKNNKGTIK